MEGVDHSALSPSNASCPVRLLPCSALVTPLQACPLTRPLQPPLKISSSSSSAPVGPWVPWSADPLHSTLHARPGTPTVYEARLPHATATALHSHVGVTAYVVVASPVAPVRTETVEWEEGEDGDPRPARLVPGSLLLTPGAAFCFAVPDPRRPLVHRLITPAGPPGALAARIVGVEVKRRGAEARGDGEEPGPAPLPFTLAVDGPGFRVLRLVLEPGAAAEVPAPAHAAVLVTVRGGGGVVDGQGGEGEGRRPSSPFIAAASAPAGVLYVEAGDGAACTLVNGGEGPYEAAVVELFC